MLSTQEDPIGLAGGLNLYGFAGGDPVNYQDPFGLRDCLKVSCPSIEAVASNSDVKAAGAKMFAASQKDGLERGAFLFNGPDGSIIVGEVRVGEAGRIRMGRAPDDAIGKIHTHPDVAPGNPAIGDRAIPGGPPSGDDHAYVRNNNVHSVVEERGSTFYIQWDRPGTVSRTPRERAPRRGNP